MLFIVSENFESHATRAVCIEGNLSCLGLGAGAPRNDDVIFCIGIGGSRVVGFLDHQIDIDSRYSCIGECRRPSGLISHLNIHGEVVALGLGEA